MYVCVCHAVSDQDIEQAIADGAQDLPSLQARLGIATGCGTCLEFTETFIDQLLVKDLSYAA